jgi:tetratricopeptide (TPR) repeat protein
MLRKVYKIVLLFLFSFIIYEAEGNPVRDSLEALLPQATEEERLKLMDRILVQTIYNDLDTSFYYANEILKGSKKLGNIKYESLAYSWLTVYHFFMGNYFNAEDYIKKAIKLQEEISDTLDLGNSYINLLMIYAETGRYKQAVEAAFTALKLFESIQYPRGLVVSNGNIGIMYSKLKEYDNAVIYLKKTGALMKKHHEYSNLGELYNNMGLAYYHLGKSDSALHYFNKAIERFYVTNEIKGVARAYLNMGNTYAFNLNEADSALSYYKKALKKSKGVIEGLKSKIYGNMGKVYAKQQDFTQAIEYLNLAVKLNKHNKENDELLDNYYELYNIYKQKKDFKEAIKYFEKYNTLEDTINVAEARVAIAKLEARFENEKNKMIIQELERKRSADKKIKTLLIAGMVLIFTIFMLVFRVIHLKRKRGQLARELLSKENEKLENELTYKTKQLTSQALMMMQKNKLLNDILEALQHIKNNDTESGNQLSVLKRKIKRGIHSDEDWQLFKHYFEEVNPEFFSYLLKINSKITPSELRLAALIRLKFNIKETASLLNISPDSVKSIRYVLRKKLGLAKGDNLIDFLNNI